MASPATDIFVSYKAEDRARVQPLVAALEAEGFSVWWDAHIGGGTNWHKDIEQHLDSAKCVVVAWSKRTAGDDGHFVRDEARRAQRRDAYVPVCIDAIEPPLGFGEIQAISLRGWKGDRSDPRFQAVADAARSHVSGEHVPLSRAYSHMRFDQPSVSRRAVIAGGGVAAVAVVGTGAWELLKPSAAAVSASIAVLPFANLSGDPAQAYFADGIADEIRSALTRLGGLTVIGSTSSQAVRNDDAKTAAQKLGVASVLTGNVRQSSSTIRVSAELIDGRTGADRWTQDYDRAPGDAIKIQTDIAENVASALKGALGIAARDALTLGGTADAEAQDLILQSRKLGRQSNSAETLRKRLALAEAAIARDAGYAEAHVDKANALWGLADIFGRTPAEVADQLAQAEAAAQRAVAIAPKLGSAHGALALIAVGRLDFPNLLRETRESLALSPDDPDVLAYASRNLALLGSVEEAVRTAERGVALDPLNARSYRFQCEALLDARRYSQAIDAGRKALQLAPDFRNTHIYIGDAILLLGHLAQAKAEYEAIGTDSVFRLARLSLLAARIGNRAEAYRMMAQLKQQVGATASSQYAEIAAQLGDKDRAFAELENAIVAEDAGIAYLQVNPFLDPIRGDPRYTALLKRLNFP